jgi:hypothetical protein
MATLTGFTRLADPIDADGLSKKITTDISIAVLAEMQPDYTVSVTGNITETNRSAIQTSINGYVYPKNPNNLVTLSMIDPDPSFSADSNNVIPTQKAVDTSIKQNRRKAYVSGVMVNGIIPYLCKTAVTNGAATLWLTDNGLSTGNAIFSTIYPEGIVINAYGTGNNYQVYNVAVAADKKSITCNVNQMAGAILGLVNVTSAANGVDVRGIVLGTI